MRMTFLQIWKHRGRTEDERCVVDHQHPGWMLLATCSFFPWTSGNAFAASDGLLYVSTVKRMWANRLPPSRGRWVGATANACGLGVKQSSGMN